MLTRGITSEYLSLAAFMVDTNCLGVRDAVFNSMGGSDFEFRILERAPVAFSDVDPSYARKLLRDVAAWAGSIGFAPHRDFATVELLLGDVKADACDETFQFGRDGKPFYIAGLSESPMQVCQRLEQLRARFGDGGFHYLAPADDGF